MFSSRLPKSTSVRRPSNPNDGHTTFVSSNIPVSVRKANLFTPQPERSHKASLGASTSRKSYQSTSKPPPDQDEQTRILRSIAEFIKLCEPNFPVPDWVNGRRFPQSVGSGDAKEIIQILINRVYPGFKVNKLEIDVPEVLTKLDYPYMKSVTRSTLVSITNSLAVRNFLTVCNWLVMQAKVLNLENYVRHTKNLRQKIFYSALEHVQDPDYIEQLLIKEYQEEYPSESCESEIVAVEHELQSLKEKYAAVEENISNYAEMEETKQKFLEYVESMTARINLKQDKIAKERDESNIRIEVEAKRQILEDLKMEAIGLEDEPQLDRKNIELKASIQANKSKLASLKSQDPNRNLIEQIEREQQRADEQKKRRIKAYSRLLDELDQVRAKHKLEEDNDAALAKLDEQYIRSLLATSVKRADSIVQEEETKHKYWLEVLKISQRNKEVVEAGARLLRNMRKK